MSNLSRKAALALAALSLTPAVIAQRTLAQSPPPGPGRPPAAYASTSASASASIEPAPPPPVESGHKLWVPRTDVTPIPDSPSPKPTREEWKTAPTATEARVTEPGCKVTRVREWYRITCHHLAIQLNGGTRDDVEFGKVFATKDISFPDEVWVVFPARRGDRRHFQMYRWSKWAPGEPDAHASEQWLDGDPLPLITVQGIRWAI